MGIEPTFEAWEAPVLPLNYTRMTFGFSQSWSHAAGANQNIQITAEGQNLLAIFLSLVGKIMLQRHGAALLFLLPGSDCMLPGPSRRSR